MCIIKRSCLIMILCLTAALLVMGCAPGEAEGVSETGRTNYKLMNGVTESTVYAVESGNENVRIHLLRVNKGAKVSFKVSTAKYYKKKSTKSSRKKAYKKWAKKNWGYADVKKQAKNYESSKDKVGKVIAASNGDYYTPQYNGATLGNLIMEGNKVRITGKKPFFAILKSGDWEIRGPGAATNDVQECVGGFLYLVHDGKVAVNKKVRNPISSRHPCQAIGIAKNKDVVIANIDGREPTSIGTSWYNLATVMKQQGCAEAIMLDGGGSASFMTKRAKGGLQVRNTPMDGALRAVTSSILLVKDKNAGGGKISGKSAVYMKNKKTGLTKTKSGVYEYKINGKAKKTGFVNVNGRTYLFNKKGKGITKKIKIGSTKYSFRKGKLNGRVVIGYCGASKKGMNLLFAYDYKHKKLNVGLNPFVKKNNGKMKNWSNMTNVPWSVEKYRVKSVTLGSGIKNIGDRFLCVTTNPFNTNMKGVKTNLRSLKLPGSLNTIGASSIYNHYHLKKVTIPRAVKTIKSNAFYYNNGTKFTFKSSKPPVIGKLAFKANKKAKGKTLFIVPGSSSWKKMMGKSSSRKRIGFSGKVKYR